MCYKVEQWWRDESSKSSSEGQTLIYSFIHWFTQRQRDGLRAQSGPLDPDDDFSSDSQNRRGNKSGPDLWFPVTVDLFWSKAEQNTRVLNVFKHQQDRVLFSLIGSEVVSKQSIIFIDSVILFSSVFISASQQVEETVSNSTHITSHTFWNIFWIMSHL